jgi:hypothetical protein
VALELNSIGGGDVEIVRLAGMEEIAAGAEYVRVLRILTDLVILDKLPED